MNLQDRFESKFSIQDNGCWVWHGYIDDGMPLFPVHRRYVSARQTALRLYKGIDVLVGHAARASCGNSLCVNPDHAEIIPRIFGRGESHPQAKLTRDQVCEIREFLAQGDLTHREIAKRFGVSRSTITHINTGRKWR